MLNVLERIDKALFELLNTHLANPVMDAVIQTMSSTMIDEFLLVSACLALALFGSKREKITAGLLILSFVFLYFTISEILTPTLGRLRPHHTLESVRLLTDPNGLIYGFISIHAAQSFSATVILSYFYPKYTKWYYSLAIFIGFSQIYMGVHYPGDILGGSLYGFGIAWTILSLWVILKMREIKRGKLWVRY